ncbi:helix-turn-helix domain-containing protein [Methylobacterium oryzisoli]|uniref:helix-turn-helix domain-containing protein n=1 Tax=Methylobacterium oryzisoli TaxID=3385502 RepID=UPI003891BB1E
MGTPFVTSIGGAGIEGFRTLCTDVFGRIRQRFLAQAGCYAQLRTSVLGGCRLSRFEASANIISGRRVSARSFDPDAVKLIVQLEGRSTLRQGGVSRDLGSGASVLYDPTRAYAVANMTAVRQIVVQIERSAFSPRALRRLSQPRLLNAGTRGLTGVVETYLAAVDREHETLAGSAEVIVGGVLERLIAALAEEGGDAPPQTSLDLLLARIKAHLDNHIEGAVSVADIAHRMGCSVRYVYRAFEAEGTTPERYVQEMRLSKARAGLVATSLSMSEIAFTTGFSSAAHFSRLFKQRFGMTPSAYRAAHLSDAALSLD